MANAVHVARVKEGLASWNTWREANPGVRVDFRGALLEGIRLDGDGRVGADLRGVDMGEANLRHASLCSADLTGARLSGADAKNTSLMNARLVGADLSGSDLSQACMRDADLRDADLTGADLSGTDLFQGRLRGAVLTRAHLIGTVLLSADLSEATLGATTLVNLDLSRTVGLSSIQHLFPSDLGYATLLKSRGRIPEDFLRGVGIPQSIVDRVASILPTNDDPPFAFRFLCHAGTDTEFAERLQARLKVDSVSSWLVSDSPKEDVAREGAIEKRMETPGFYDKLLLVISEASLESEWLSKVIHRARRLEFYEFRRILFPIRISSAEVMEKLAEKLGATLGSQYVVHDFSGWKYELREDAVQRLLEDLRADANREGFDKVR